ncbi:hypothetical protein CDD80_4795 [Ophiocordyceps camponoti-rufipedis]|uniref:Tr-type G domain-containing protein n=1 Tax=Ophiocordyceps camponoti-rufipedis TaxID=2004952 RepID=A0A2C5ZJP7_9HYPO|nr:hypothetical protein CDD80_4795 [Ophiocordyceps camponoti-rufipedis]
MASVFTYDPDPPRVSSPWLAADASFASDPSGSSDPKSASEYGLTKLEAEPEYGPTEYKLHLLLRPRRAYSFMSTNGSRILRRNNDLSDESPSNIYTGSATSSLPKHERLKHLTTQLLWRLQQSSPYHASGSKDSAAPRFPGHDVELDAPVKIERLVPGLRESRGALYELGVSDDGTLMGLTEDEMRESIATLRTMAASLGCAVDVVRVVIVGDCEWIEPEEAATNIPPASSRATKKARLWVAEALVAPSLGNRRSSRDSGLSISPWAPTSSTTSTSQGMGSLTPQLRVTLTGPTTCGKSSLLGTLSTGTLDNGRGKSRLSLLKHPHEIVSGVTSSIAQELIGYKKGEIINFARADIESWVDIHDCAENGRLVFVSDSGGHPRYRHSTLRGLLSWAPHWSILCVAADVDDEDAFDDCEASTASRACGNSNAQKELAQAHLTLSVKLNVPMVIVITKLDLASKSNLHRTMARVLTSIKKAGRTPRILQPDQRVLGHPKHISREDDSKVEDVINSIAESGTLTDQVPIILTSAVKGIGIGLLHALLARLPLHPITEFWDLPISSVESRHPNCLFHVDSTFRFPEAHSILTLGPECPSGRGVIVSGHVRFGNLSIGDTVVVGPFQTVAEDACGWELSTRKPTFPESYDNPRQRGSVEVHVTASTGSTSTIAAADVEEWRKATVVSIRNLRLPVSVLEAGQAGSVGLVFEPRLRATEPASEPRRIRRGMVLASLSKEMADHGLSLQAASRLTASFCDPAVHLLIEGSLVHVYFASVRAIARVIGICHQNVNFQGCDEQVNPMAGMSNGAAIFTAADINVCGVVRPDRDPGRAEVTLELLHKREWIGLGCTILLLKAGGRDVPGLDVSVGRCVKVLQ